MAESTLALIGIGLLLPSRLERYASDPERELFGITPDCATSTSLCQCVWDGLNHPSPFRKVCRMKKVPEDCRFRGAYFSEIAPLVRNIFGSTIPNPIWQRI